MRLVYAHFCLCPSLWPRPSGAVREVSQQPGSTIAADLTVPQGKIKRITARPPAPPASREARRPPAASARCAASPEPPVGRRVPQVRRSSPFGGFGGVRAVSAAPRLPGTAGRVLVDVELTLGFSSIHAGIWRSALARQHLHLFLAGAGIARPDDGGFGRGPSMTTTVRDVMHFGQARRPRRFTDRTSKDPVSAPAGSGRASA